MSTPAEIAAAMAACGLSADQVAAVLSKLQCRSAGAERQARYRARKASQTVTSDVTSDVTKASPSVTDDALPRTPIHAGVLDAQNLDIKQESKINSSLRSESSTSPNAPVDLLGETEKFSKSKANRTEAVETIRVAGEGWNAMAASLSLPAIDSIKPGSAREKHTLARARDLRTDHELDAAAGFAKLFNLIRGSPYLRGEVNGFVATFDWIIKPSNFLKIMEGNYEIRQQKIAGYGQRDYRRTA